MLLLFQWWKILLYLIGNYTMGSLIETQDELISRYYNWLYPGLIFIASQICSLTGKSDFIILHFKPHNMFYYST
jgi:hypothetical protein